MAGLRTAVILEAIETLDRAGMPGTILVQELSADLAQENAYNFADKLNKRMQVVLKYSDTHVEKDDGDDDDEQDEPEEDREPSPQKSKTKSADKPATSRPAKSVEDLLDEIV